MNRSMWPLAHEVVSDQARRRPDAIALEVWHEAGTNGDGDARRTWTYARLDQEATRVAACLLDAGLVRGDLVGLWAERNKGSFAALLGIWKAGGIALPLDPNAPRSRTDGMVQDARPRWVLGAPAEALTRWSVPVFDPSTAPAAASRLPAMGPDDGAYVLFTSGSTGRPKGVRVSHGALAHRIGVLATDMFDVQETDRVSQYCTWTWDAALFEFYLAFAHGAILSLIPEPIRRSGTALGRHLERTKTDIAFFPPPVLATIPVAPLPSVRVLITGGDALPESLVDAWGPTRRIFNVYGPTETTVWMTTAACVPGETVTLGHPIPGVDVRIVDDALVSVPQGDVGEILIAGEGIADGYLDRPDDTARRFVRDPLRPGLRAYRSGDRGRILPDGRIAFLGRIDRQVKVRGVRIELGEIEAAIRRLSGVTGCTVTTAKDPRGDRRIYAYLVVPDGPDAPTFAEPSMVRKWRGLLRDHLAEAVQPAAFILLPHLPHHPNGKIDQASLPKPDQFTLDGPAVEPPRTDLERIIATAWAEELGIYRLGRNENVFELGAHSLAAAHVQATLERVLGQHIEVLHLFESPTVAALAACLTPTSPGVKSNGARSADDLGASGNGARDDGAPSAARPARAAPGNARGMERRAARASRTRNHDPRRPPR